MRGEPARAIGVEPPTVVVGAGPCAAVAARELVRAGRPVTMLDAGRGAPRGLVVRLGGHTVVRWVQRGYLSTNRQRGASDPNTEWTSSLSLGGLSNYWTGASPRFAPEDFTEGARLDERFEWPIRYDDLVPYYELVEQDLQLTAGEPFANVPAGRVAHRWDPPKDWRELAAAIDRRGDSLRPIPIAKGPPWMVAMRPREFTSYHCIIRPLLDDPNFRLVSRARVLRVNLDAASGRAASIDYGDTETGSVLTIPVRAVVLAAGTLDSTEILLRSVSRDLPTGIGGTHGVVGRYLHDHPKEWWTARLSRPLTSISHPMVISREPFDRSEPLLGASLTMGRATAPDRLRSLVGRRLHRLGVQVLGTMVPDPDRGVSLAAGCGGDELESALAIDLRFDGRAVDTVLRARQRCVDVFAAAGQPIEIGPFPALKPGASYHLGGTLRMHRRPEFGVVDHWNRVFDVPNVVVADASCFTTGPEKNPTLTAMALAARAARKLGGSDD